MDMEVKKKQTLREEDKVYLSLPPSVKDAHLEESKLSIEAIKQGLAWSVSVSDFYRGCNYYIKKLDV